MVTATRHTAVLALGGVLLAVVVACGGSEPSEADIEATVVARVELAKASLVAPTAAPLPTPTPIIKEVPVEVIKEVIVEKIVEVLVTATPTPTPMPTATPTAIPTPTAPKAYEAVNKKSLLFSVSCFFSLFAISLETNTHERYKKTIKEIIINVKSVYDVLIV